MESEEAILAFAALAHSTRLDVVRLLIEKEPNGLPSGEIADLLAVRPNTMSTHLAVLARAGLIESERRSRLIVYRARLEMVRDLAGYLLKDCCGGNPQVCGPLVADLAPVCTPGKSAPKETTDV